MSEPFLEHPVIHVLIFSVHALVSPQLSCRGCSQLTLGKPKSHGLKTGAISFVHHCILGYIHLIYNAGITHTQVFLYFPDIIVFSFFFCLQLLILLNVILTIVILVHMLIQIWGLSSGVCGCWWCRLGPMLSRTASWSHWNAIIRFHPYAHSHSDVDFFSYGWRGTASTC